MRRGVRIGVAAAVAAFATVSAVAATGSAGKLAFDPAEGGILRARANAYVKSNGHGTSHGTHGKQADLDVKAGDGTGYSAFTRAKSDSYSIHDPSDRKIFMRGWVVGTVFYNSIWAPLSSAGHFELTVTCTDDADAAAYMQKRDTDDWFYLVFPWGELIRARGGGSARPG